jgi:hypothetical protein
LRTLERDTALGRIGRVRRWFYLGAAALTAGFAALTSAVAHGHTVSARRAPNAAGKRSPKRAVAAVPPMPALATPGELGLQPPEQAPQPAPGPSQSSPGPSQAAPSPPPQAAPAPAPAPAPQPSGGGAAVSGGS